MTNPQMIDSFSGDYAWLSNFWPCEVTLGNKKYPSVENAYQAAKYPPGPARIPFQTCAPGKAKRLGRKADTSLQDWDLRKLEVMFYLLKQKFAPGKTLTRRLIKTYPVTLVEGNHWNDTFWGVCGGRGENRLGLMLMEIRDLRM